MTQRFLFDRVTSREFTSEGDLRGYFKEGDFKGVSSKGVTSKAVDGRKGFLQCF